MDELSLYEKVLALSSPWSVEQVKLENNAVSVFVAVDSEYSLCCPECGKRSPRYDHRRRKWRHLDTCQYKTFVIADVPRVQCKEHGCKTINVSWAEDYSRYTALFEAMVINWLKQASILAVQQQLRMSWNAVDGIMQRAVARGVKRQKKRINKHICVDEVAIQKGHKYMTIVSTPNGDVVRVEKERKKESLKRYFDTLSDQEKKRLQVISMDMSPTYVAVTLEEIPDAKEKIAFDRFHVAQMINRVVDKVRKSESVELHSVLKEQGLTGSRFLWLKGSDKLGKTQKKKLKKLCKLSNRTGRAWLLKEYAKTLWDYSVRGWAERGWLKWYSRAVRSQIKLVVALAKTIKEKLWGILNAIELNANNGKAESINSKIKMIKGKARGFRNSERFKTSIMFHCGGLELYPLTHSNK